MWLGFIYMLHLFLLRKRRGLGKEVATTSWWVCGNGNSEGHVSKVLYIRMRCSVYQALN